jgi:hypothetical protein
MSGTRRELCAGCNHRDLRTCVRLELSEQPESGYCETLVDELSKGVAPLSYRSVVCTTYFMGVGDALLRQGGADPSNPCMTKHYLNLDDLRHPKIFLEYLKRNPTRGDDFASDAIRDSLKEICTQ